MDKKMVAKELVAIAEDLTSGVRRFVGASKDLAELKKMWKSSQDKQEEIDRKRKEMEEQINKMSYELNRDMESGSEELVSDIQRQLERYFLSSSMKGVRKSGNSGTLVEVFLGSGDGVNREQSKVSAHISVYSAMRITATGMFRNENLEDDRKFTLSDRDTVGKLMEMVKKADKEGYWDRGVEE